MNNNSSSSSVRAATTTTAMVPPPSTIQIKHASPNGYDPTDKTEPAEAPEQAPPSTEDPHDECVLCCYPLPLKGKESRYKECCGEVICRGCIVAQQRTLIIGTNVKKPIAGSQEEESEFMTMLLSEQTFACPFCRVDEPKTEKQHLKRLRKRMNKYNDPKAINLLGDTYLTGNHGLTKNLKKAEELYQRSYDLGDPIAAYDLAELYTKYFPDQQACIMKYLEEGVKRGNTHCNNFLGVRAAQSGNHEEAKRQFMTAARIGDEKAMSNLMINYQVPGSMVSKDDLATTLRANKACIDKRMSEPREYAIRCKDLEKKLVQLVPKKKKLMTNQERQGSGTKINPSKHLLTGKNFVII